MIAVSYELEDKTSINQQGHITEEEVQVSRKHAYAQSSNYEPLLMPETPIWPLQEAGSLGPSSGTHAQGQGQGWGWGYQRKPRIVMTDTTPIPGSHVTALDLGGALDITPVRSLWPQTLAKKRVRYM